MSGRAWVLLALAAAGAASVGCSSDQASPVNVEVIAWDKAGHLYRLSQVRLNTLQSLRHLEGSAGTVRLGGSAQLLAAQLRTVDATVAGLRSVATQAAPTRIDLAYAFVGDVAYAEDYASLELLSSYAALEQVRASAGAWGASVAQLPAAPIWVHTKLVDDAGLSVLPEGELFSEPLGVWVFPGPSARQQLAPQLNPGALGHGLGHALIQQDVWQGLPVPPAERAPPDDAKSAAAKHVARSMTEGMSDFFGGVASENPQWMSASLVQDLQARALNKLHCATPEMNTALSVPDATAPYDPYPLGSVLGSALWTEAQSDADLAASATNVTKALASLRVLAQNQGGSLTWNNVLDSVVTAWDPASAPSLCGLFLDRFGKMGIPKIASCGGNITPVPPKETCGP